MSYIGYSNLSITMKTYKFQFITLLILSITVCDHYVIQAQKIQKSEMDSLSEGLRFRNIGPFRGGRSVAASGVIGDPMTYYMGTCGGGVYKTNDAGISWRNISDGYFRTGSVGSIEVATSDPNIIYVGMGEHAIRGVMTSHGDGMYKSMDGGDTWTHIGLPNSRHIAEIKIHPDNPDVVYVAVQGAAYGASADRGLYKSSDGGKSWIKILYIDDTTGVSDLSMDIHNPRILYASTWDHRRYPWQVRSGGPGSGFYKSTDGGENWEQLKGGLPEKVGKTSIDVSPANSNVVYVNVESAGDKGGVYRSNDGGKTWKQTTKDRITVARAWYYIEIFADPVNENIVYVLNAPMLKSIDGGRTFESIRNPHGDQHHLWINPNNPSNILLANDGGACVTFNGGKTWSSQQNQATAQFYRVITDNQFPYFVYGGQQDNSTVAIASRTNGRGIGQKDWFPVAGGESAFLAFDANDPKIIFGGSYQGNISVFDQKTNTNKDIMAHPIAGLGWLPSEMKYRFNWNAPIVASPHDPNVIYHGANLILKSTDQGMSWDEVSPDLTRNDDSKHIEGGAPYTNEGAGGEVYNTISYLECSEHDPNVIWTGSDCGLVYLTQNGGTDWTNVTPNGLTESLINSIDVSPHDPSKAIVVASKYKFNDFTPLIYMTNNYGKSWQKITNGISKEHWVRVVREDEKRPGLLFAGTEGGLYTSYDDGSSWTQTQYGLPICPISDLTFRQNDLVVATLGRSFWILDDISSLQQNEAVLENNKIALFAPRDNIRFVGNMRTGGSGQNPANGVTIDYFIPEKMDTTELSLNILNNRGELVRSFSSQKDKSFKKYDGGPQAAKLLSTKKGINRMNWDLRRSTLPGVEKVFSLGSYQGSFVAPGNYTIQVSDGVNSVEQPLVLKADPRMDIPQSTYDEQVNTLTKLEETVKDINESVTNFRSVKKRIALINEQLSDYGEADSLLSKSNNILDKINSWEESLIQAKQKTFQDVINFPNKLSAEIMNLISRINGSDPRLTRGAKERRDELINEWVTLKSKMNDIVNVDIAGFNQDYKAEGIPILIVPGKNKKVIKP